MNKNNLKNFKVLTVWQKTVFSLNSQFSILYSNKGQSPVVNFRSFLTKEIFSKFLNRKSTTGQSLIEVLLIVVLITSVIAGSVGFLVQAYSITQLVSDQTTATYLSIEGIEVSKNLLDANYLKGNAWNAGFSAFGIYQIDYQSAELERSLASGNLSNEKLIKFDPATNRYGYFDSPQDISISGADTPQQFKRRIEITPVDACEVKVVSVVDWQSRRCPSGGCTVKLEDHFYDWRSSSPKCQGGSF